MLSSSEWNDEGNASMASEANTTNSALREVIDRTSALTPAFANRSSNSLCTAYSHCAMA